MDMNTHRHTERRLFSMLMYRACTYAFHEACSFGTARRTAACRTLRVAIDARVKTLTGTLDGHDEGLS